MANSGEKVLYFLIGGFVGASVALLFAPRSGEETRNYLEGKYREGADRIGRTVRDNSEALAERAREATDRVGRAGREFGDRVAQKGKDLSERVSEGVDRGRETVGRQRDQITAAIEAGKRAYHDEKEKLEAVEGEGRGSYSD